MGSVVADAMAGPHEGRTTQKSREFLKSGDWLNTFDYYTPYHQTHWNVYPKQGRPGLYTDDNRMRLMIAQAMIKYNQKQHNSLLTREHLAEHIYKNYLDAYQQFQDLFGTEPDLPVKNQKIKEAFLHLWFMWELVKTATSVFIPEKYNIYSPGYRRLNLGSNPNDWSIVPDQHFQLHINIKSSYHNDTYARNEEMPLGMIALLPVAIYFPGRPTDTFEYILDVDFFDIGKAPFYTAFLTSILSGILGGLSWKKMTTEIKKNGLHNFFATERNNAIEHLSASVLTALEISESFRKRKKFNWRREYIEFIENLHKTYAVGEVQMCTIDEMVSVPVALLDYGQEVSLKEMIELSVNYGRDNDTVASICASLHGAWTGRDNLPDNWIKLVQKANPAIDIKSTAKVLASINEK
jgi:ADP-ribosylglycohydrolase